MSVLRSILRGVLRPVSAVGLLVAVIFFGLSVTPSMVPRSPELQGALGGLIAALGYLIWWLAACLLAWLGLWSERRVSRPGRIVLMLVSAVIAVVFLWKAADWQNSIQHAWGLAPLEASAPLRVAAIAVAVFVILLVAGRLFRGLAKRLQARSLRVLPPRMAQAAGMGLAVLVFAATIDGVAVRGVLRTIDTGARLADAIIPPDLAPPDTTHVSGGPGSLLDWEDLGRWGRNFVASGPTAAKIADFWNAPARQPIRIYTGLNAAETPDARAQLAFDELLRAGGFDRQVLVIAMPTGSGWLDPGGMDTLDYITRGDVATVAVQYSYLPSPVSVVVDPMRGVAEAQALFDKVYRHWSDMPQDTRPRLYLHGLSLGAFLSQQTVPLLDLYADPIHGALWTGSPYLSEFWRMVQARRHPDSPAWRPRFGNGSLIRTRNQQGGLDRFDAAWGPMRFVFLQYGSDPIVFFDWSLAWSRPDWLSGERAPDLSPKMRWIPVVTLFQVGLDMAVALGTLGYGHDYVARHYIPAWAETLAPEGWTTHDETRLKAHLIDLVPR
ncbi:alpha/beta hydrolase [Roseovarius tibetensis]|uniref:alpha/beta hydrolase n=1 Tax=Roseovarius tibetensis TaxID=2685897 RepID=UPI003D7F83FF